MFPIEMFDEIRKAPQHYRLLQLVPYQTIEAFPCQLSSNIGDEIIIAIIDTETTGFNAYEDEVIEFGWVHIAYSPSADIVTAVLEKGTMYQQPSCKIPEVITEITGINDEMVKGKSFDLDTVKRVLTSNVDFVVAHNKEFDKGFIEETFKSVLVSCTIHWACSIKQINWKIRGFASNSLEMLLLKSGFFYTAHRADTDCLALSFLLANNKGVLKELIENANKNMHIIQACGAPFHVKDELKGKGFTWNNKKRVWEKEVEQNELDSTLNELDNLYAGASVTAEILSIEQVTQY